MMLSVVRKTNYVRIWLSALRNKRLYSKQRVFPVLTETLLSPTAEALALAEEDSKKHSNLVNLCEAGGGERGISRHVKKNKKVLVRKRIEDILDDDSDFLELQVLAGLGMPYGDIPSAGIVTGIGKVHGNYCMVMANDATVKGGTYFPITVRKGYRAQEIAETLHIPCLYLVDSGGAFLPFQSDIFPDRKHGGRSFYNQAIMSSKGIPQIALVCGSCTAGGAYAPTMSQHTIMTNRIATIFLGGPPLVKAATGEVVTEDELGGASLHCGISGCSDYFAENEAESFEICRDVIAALNLQSVSAPSEFEQPLYNNAELDAVAYMNTDRSICYYILSRLLDGSRFREYKQRYVRNLVAGYGYLEGYLVGVVISNGPLSSQDALTGSNFVGLCDQQQIPLIFMHGTNSKDDVCDYTVIKDRGKMAASIATATTCKISIIMNSCCDDNNFTMCGPGLQPDFVFAWPRGDLGMRMSSEQELPVNNAFNSAAHCLVDGILLPHQTRKVIGQCLRIACYGREQRQHTKMLTQSVIRM